MPFMAVGQRVLITAVGEYYGQRTMTSWLYRVSGIGGEITDTAFFSALDLVTQGAGGLLVRYRACCPNEGAWVGVATWYQVLGPLRFRKVQRGLGDGTFASTSNTANLQASITRVGEFGTRRNIGGIRLPMPSFESIDGKISIDYRAAMAQLASVMSDPITAGANAVTLLPQVGVPGYTNSNPPTQIPVTDSLDLAECVSQDTTRVLRRRTLRLGI
jgi:hypothetical protein